MIVVTQIPGQRITRSYNLLVHNTDQQLNNLLHKFDPPACFLGCWVSKWALKGHIKYNCSRTHTHTHTPANGARLCSLSSHCIQHCIQLREIPSVPIPHESLQVLWTLVVILSVMLLYYIRLDQEWILFGYYSVSYIGYY